MSESLSCPTLSDVRKKKPHKRVYSGVVEFRVGTKPEPARAVFMSQAQHCCRVARMRQTISRSTVRVLLTAPPVFETLGNIENFLGILFATISSEKKRGK